MSYEQIIELYPNFSLYELYARYVSWNCHKSSFKLDDSEFELYAKLSGLKFHVFCGCLDDDFGFTIDEKDLETWEEIFPDAEYRSGEFVVSREHPNISRALVQIAIDQGKPGVNRPYVNNLVSMSYSKPSKDILENIGTGKAWRDVVERIRLYDPDFTIEGLYSSLLKQYNNASELPEEYRAIFDTKKVDTIFCDSEGRIVVENDEGETLLEVDGGAEELFKSMVAYVYRGINTSYTSLVKDDMINLDTY